MYVVVGCSDCSALWVVTDDRDTTQCPRCGTRHQFDRLKRFVETDDEAHAREVRASMLAARQDQSDAFASVDSYAALEERLEDSGVDDGQYLVESGIDPNATAAAGRRATEGAGGSRSREAVVREALRTLEAPDRAAVCEYATDRGVPEDAVETLLNRLSEAGELVEANGRLRLL